MGSLNGTHRMTADEAVVASKAKGFKLNCPSCGETKVTIHLALDDLCTCKCSECEDEFDVQTAINDLTEQLERWQALALWIEMADAAL